RAEVPPVHHDSEIVHCNAINDRQKERRQIQKKSQPDEYQGRRQAEDGVMPRSVTIANSPEILRKE
ncbi:MAG TPA: hypothetical protein VN794_15130, partial [Methylomirabilota bacterium]|nr:hypothetical protein [Methylomirabilota bacterium]